MEELTKLKERFEIEIWLYLDESLNEDEISFWDEQLSKYDELQEMLNQTTLLLKTYESTSTEGLLDAEYQRMINTAVDSKSFIDNLNEHISQFLEFLFSNNVSAAKAVFTAVLTVVALVLLLTTEKPNAVQKISSDILSWRGESISQQIYDVDESIQTLSIDEWEKFELIQSNFDEWEQSYYLLNNEIDQMRKDLGDTSL